MRELYQTLRDRVVFVVGRQRSGTNILRQEVASRFEARNIGEVITEFSDQGDFNFFHYYYDQIINDKNDLGLNKEEKIFEEFLYEIAKTHDTEKCLIDIKYGSLGAIRSPRYYGAHSPITEIAARFEIPIVHIVRENKLNVIISETMARATGRWSARTKEELDRQTTIELDENFLIQRLYDEVALTNAAAQQIGVRAGNCTVFYEQIFRSEGFIDTFYLDLIGKVCKLKPRKRRGPMTEAYIKQAVRPNSETVANWDRVVAILSQTGFGWMLHDGPGRY